jgi:hypothetical protein
VPLFFHLYDDRVVLDAELPTVGEEFTVQARGGFLFKTDELLGHYPVEVVGCYRHGQVEIHLDDDGGGQAVEVEEGNLFGYQNQR